MRIELGDTLALRGKSNKGRELVRVWGKDWVVCAVSLSVQSLGNKLGAMIAPAKFFDADKRRWIAITDDRDFTIDSVSWEGGGQ